MDNLENEEGVSAGDGASVASKKVAVDVVGETPTGTILAVAGIGVTGTALGPSFGVTGTALGPSFGVTGTALGPSFGVTGSTGQQYAVDAIAGVAEPHPALAALDRLHEKLNTLGSFVVAETDALIAEIRNRLV